MTAAALSGFLTGLGLIAAIGAQNAFVLRQGLRREHVLAVVAVCALSDAALIAAGVAGVGAAVTRLPWLAEAMRWAGAAFLFAYGAMRFRAALRGGLALMPAPGDGQGLGRTIAMCLLFTWANPHVYLDTLLLIGAVSVQHAPHQTAFGIGAGVASVVFFSALGFGARLLAPVFARPRAWVVLELLVGLLMWALAAGLAFG
ncbi:LysE/ArgO family amino acid transporter [Ruixingdingia sedimenti]|uniref:LysE family transporter n=1 Tax=Ruixingdingia sedimenti TaxID=3073604 RepID=A0ABU1F6L3_9RHOB|nr:LysE family transporter [Xinfangfangia sp. LG-4]MDR5652243.1 LysE family transporter [Xinfangfangia sp. LG-4]